ncbi:uncharacterized protein DS421_16g548400 [Arachis hypogaea]|nr:uncharacterized protein DS421_16g548400 [Arachis hypogaea]
MIMIKRKHEKKKDREKRKRIRRRRKEGEEEEAKPAVEFSPPLYTSTFFLLSQQNPFTRRFPSSSTKQQKKQPSEATPLFLFQVQGKSDVVLAVGVQRMRKCTNLRTHRHLQLIPAIVADGDPNQEGRSKTGERMLHCLLMARRKMPSWPNPAVEWLRHSKLGIAVMVIIHSIHNMRLVCCADCKAITCVEVLFPTATTTSLYPCTWKMDMSDVFELISPRATRLSSQFPQSACSL